MLWGYLLQTHSYRRQFGRVSTVLIVECVDFEEESSIQNTVPLKGRRSHGQDFGSEV